MPARRLSIAEAPIAEAPIAQAPIAQAPSAPALVTAAQRCRLRA